MRSGRIAAHPGALVLFLGVALLAAGCGGSSSYPEVTVSTPELASEGRALTVEQWRRGVGDVCRQAAVAVGGASQKLSQEINSGEGVIDEGEISRRAFELGKPVFEEQLRALAQLRPPPELASGYQGFIANLSEELLWTGRIAQMLGTDASKEAMQQADQGLADSASEASDFVRENRLGGCLLAAGESP